MEAGPRSADLHLRELDRVLADRSVRPVYQPVVEVDTGAVVAFEALARGPAGSPLERPDQLFATARAAGRVAELDWLCRLAAFDGGLQHGVPAALGLFLNVEPAALNSPPPPGADSLLTRVAHELPIVMEITERALTIDPAGLLRSAERARGRGWRIAVDDVGADRDSLAFLPLLNPEIIKLDMRLVQSQPSREIAEIVTAVNVQAERSGAVVLAEGIETSGQAEHASMLGATLGQGWLYGRPGPLPTAGPPTGLGEAAPSSSAASAVEIAARQAADRRSSTGGSLFALLPAGAAPRIADRQLLEAFSRHLEHQALTSGESTVVLAGFQRAECYTPEVARRYAEIGAVAAYAGVFAVGFPDDVSGSVRTVGLRPHDPLSEEWAVVVVGPHVAALLLARPVVNRVSAEESLFEHVLTYDRDTVVAVATELLLRTPSSPPAPMPARNGSAAVPAPRPAGERSDVREHDRTHAGGDAAGR